MDEGDGVGGGDLLGKVGSNSLYSEYLFAFDAGSIFISILFRYCVEGPETIFLLIEDMPKVFKYQAWVFWV